MIKNRILWLCHFTNDEIQNILPLWKRKSEFAFWIPNMLKGFETRSDIELHVVSPHEYLKKQSSFILRNIHYHFIPVGIPFIRRHWPGFLRYDIFSNFVEFRKHFAKLLNNIQPDLIDLIGSENAYYSSAILDLDHIIPIIFGIQGFVGQTRGMVKKSEELSKRIEIEERILQEFKYYYGENDSSNYISQYNPDHKFYKLYFPIDENLAYSIKEQAKIYDCIYYGSLSKIKGTEDFIKVIAELKVELPDIKACIAGAGNPDPFRIIAEKLNCSDNITFKGFIKTQKELFELVKSSKVFLAPPHKERLSMTIREAMFLKVPIVAYATGGIPYINEFSENILMVNTGDYKRMALETLTLLKDQDTSGKLAQKAYDYALQEFSLHVNQDRLISAYHEVIKNY